MPLPAALALDGNQRVEEGSGGGGRYSLRESLVGKSAPNGTHLALRGIAGIDDGLYHYRADHHALELRNSGAWIEKLSHELKIPWAANSSFIVGLTSIFLARIVEIP